MSELIWLNGEVMPMSEARIGVEDRGFQFADGVYEVIRVYRGRAFMLEHHLRRLQNSAEGIRLKLPMETAKLAEQIVGFARRTGIADGMIYLQLTRGQAPRNHLYSELKPTILFYVRPLADVVPVEQQQGVKLLSVPDERWQKCWIKSIALLPNVLAKNYAVAEGADEAVFVDDGIVTECSASNIFAVLGRRVVTHPVGRKVLGGMTREMILELARAAGLEVQERGMSEEEAMGADEVFVSSTTREISWVRMWNQSVMGEMCGAVTRLVHGGMKARIGAVGG